MARVLVTGAAGFIGHALAARLLSQGDTVLGIDNLSAYYDVSLKHARLENLKRSPAFSFAELDIVDAERLDGLFSASGFDIVVHLAAQAGVRYSLANPRAYIDTNVTGFLSILEACRHRPPGHLVYASSSSVYGGNTKLPFSVSDSVDHPVSLYAATKKANELMAHTYCHLFGLRATGLRFFTVYGPWGRPDMALFTFTKAILEDRPIDVYNQGDMSRDFTYIDDIVDGIVRVMDRPPKTPESIPGVYTNACHRLYNIGNHRPTRLLDLIDILERKLGKSVLRNLLPMQPGDVQSTFADIADLTRDTGFHPRTDIEEGVGRFVDWYRSFYRV